MTARTRHMLDSITQWLEQIGATDIRLEHRRHGHSRIYFTVAGVERYKAVSGSTSSQFSHLRAITDIKHMIGRVGR